MVAWCANQLATEPRTSFPFALAPRGSRRAIPANHGAAGFDGPMEVGAWIICAIPSRRSTKPRLALHPPTKRKIGFGFWRSGSQSFSRNVRSSHSVYHSGGAPVHSRDHARKNCFKSFPPIEMKSAISVELARREGKAWRLQHRADFKVSGRICSWQAVSRSISRSRWSRASVNSSNCATKGEHHAERAALSGPDQRLKLHPHDTWLIAADANGAPAQCGVRLV